ncbi:protein FAM26F-like isoform X2 [Stylophora pistillata]|nr:protein FAM26F-like isoform X2 [Stylophora pistillata]
MGHLLELLERRYKYSKGPIQNSIILVIIYGFEEYIRTQLLRCPCTNYFMYSLVMLVGPALFLLGLGFMMSGGFWQSILKTSRMPDVKERCNKRMKSLTKLFQPFLAPMAYITIVLLKGDFFVCLSYGSLNEACHRNLQDSDNSNIPHDQRSLLKVHMQSQILGLGILIAATLFSLGLVCIRRCCFEDDVLPNNDDYNELEKEILGRLFRKRLDIAIEEDTKKRINDAFQIKTHRDLRDTFHKAKEALTAANQFENRNGRYNRLNIDDDDTELQLMDSTHL